MGRATLSGRPFYVCFEISQSEFQCITVALALGLRHAFHHAAPLVRGVFSVFYPNVTSGSRLFHTFLSISLYVKGPRSDGRCERSTGHALPVFRLRPARGHGGCPVHTAAVLPWLSRHRLAHHKGHPLTAAALHPCTLSLSALRCPGASAIGDESA